MPLIIPPEHYEMAFHHVLAGTTRPAVVTFGAEYTGTDFAVDSANLGGAWANVMSGLSNAVTYRRFTMRTQAGLVRDLAVNVVGGETDPCAPYSVAYLVKKTTVMPGRRHQGRMYLPGVAETDVDSAGILAPALFTSLQTVLTAFLAEFGARNFAPMILHTSDENGLPEAVPTFVSGLSLDSRVATQRNRLRR